VTKYGDAGFGVKGRAAGADVGLYGATRRAKCGAPSRVRIGLRIYDDVKALVPGVTGSTLETITP
jgi:hypothetical protein